MNFTAPKLELAKVSQSFRTGRDEVVAALQSVDLVIPTGKFVSIIGPSGCGKSTLFNVVAGLQTPSNLDGQRIR